MYKKFPRYFPSFRIFIRREDRKNELIKLLDQYEIFRTKKLVKYFYHLFENDCITIVFVPFSDKKEKFIVDLINEKYPTIDAPIGDEFSQSTSFFKTDIGVRFEMSHRHINEVGGLPFVIYSENTLHCFSQIQRLNAKRNVVALSQWLPYLFYLYITIAKEFEVEIVYLKEIFKELRLESLPKEDQQQFNSEDDILEFRTKSSEIENKIKLMNEKKVIDFNHLFIQIYENVESIDLGVEWQKSWGLCRRKYIRPWGQSIKTESSESSKEKIHKKSTGLKYVINAWSNQMQLERTEMVIAYDFFYRVLENKAFQI